MQNVTAVTSFKPRKAFNVVPAQALMELFLSEEGLIHKRLFAPRLLTQFQAMKEILLAGDTNRLVAELTFVRINDLATPPEPTVHRAVCWLADHRKRRYDWLSN